jgi:hypothetical protein
MALSVDDAGQEDEDGAGWIVGVGAMGHTHAETLGMRVVDADLALSRSERGVRFSSVFTIRFRDAYTRQMLAWIRSVHDGRTVGASAVDGLRTTLVAEPGERALQSACWEKVES